MPEPNDPIFWMAFLLILSMILLIIYACQIEYRHRHPKPSQRIPYPNEQEIFKKVYEDRKFDRDFVRGKSGTSPLDNIGYHGE